MKSDLIVRMKWDAWNTTIFVSKLARHVEKGDLEFEFKAKHGSLESDFVITCAAGVASNIAVLLFQYIWDRIRKQREQRNELPPVTFIVKNETYIIHGLDEDRRPTD